MRKLILIGALALTGCASSSGVYAVGTNTYQISASAITSFGGSTTARGEALRQANEFCTGQGKQAIIVDTQQASQITHGVSDVTFVCSDGSTQDVVLVDKERQRALQIEVSQPKQPQAPQVIVMPVATPQPKPTYVIPPIPQPKPTVNTNCYWIGQTMQCTSN